MKYISVDDFNKYIKQSIDHIIDVFSGECLKQKPDWNYIEYIRGERAAFEEIRRHFSISGHEKDEKDILVDYIAEMIQWKEDKETIAAIIRRIEK